MEIKLITGATTFEACVNTIKQIDISNLDKTNIVVVPDSFSMQAESLIFDVLKIKSTLNIEVVGISRLASKILRNNNISFERVSGLEEVFCMFKVVKQNEDKFVYFHTCDADFCVKLLQIIKQFKACKIKSNQIKPVGDQLLDKKMSDLKLIYENYEKELGDKLDLSKLLTFFTENAQQNLDLSKTNLFFVNFDSFSTEINSFVCQLAKSVNKTFIGYARAISQKNAFIYEDDILKKTMKLAKENGIFVQVENFETSLEGEHLAMAKNLFGFEVDKGTSDFFVNVVAKNKQEEVDFVAKYIKNRVFKGARFKDFAIAISDEKYLDIIKTKFLTFDIPYYADCAVDLSQTVLGHFVLKILEIAKLGFNATNLKYLLNFPFKNISEKEKKLSEIFYLNISNETEFLERYQEHRDLIWQIKNLKNCKDIDNFSKILKNIIDFVDFEKILNDIKSENLHKKESENLQSKELIESVLNKLCEISQGQQIDLFDFESLLKMAFVSVKVETIPSYIDAVYVGDATTSYFEDVDTLFVLGATANALPRNQNDTGIIDDDDIKKLRLEFALEPEIKVLNRRARLKIFEMLQHAKRQLFVCTPISQDGKLATKAGFVNDLMTLFGQNVLHTKSMEDYNLSVNDNDEEIDKILFNLGCEKNFLLEYSKLKGQNKLPRRLAGTLNALAKDKISDEKLFEINNKNLEKNVYSASELESYFSCPFKHFVQYMLKIRPNENIEPNKRLFGNFQHALLNLFLENFEKNSQNIDKFLKENILKIAEQVYHEKILLRKSFLKYLFDESKIILKNIVFEQKNSKFSPILLEEKVFYPISQNKNLVGFVDRVDRAEKYFRIIDYKTGKTDGVRKDLFYGKKLQLFLYANSIKSKLGLDCAGVYYFDCQTKYLKTNQKTTLLKGVTLKDDGVVMLTDLRLWQDDFRSDLIGMSRKKKTDEDFSYKNGTPADDMEQMLEYSKNVSLKAIEEIEDAFVQPKPFKDECKTCAFLSVCKYHNAQGYRTMQLIKNFKRVSDEN